MDLPRMHLFEFNDSAWAPVAVRETVIETLSRTLAWGHMLRGLVPPFRRFVAEAGVRDVLDLCAGAGGPAEILLGEFARAGFDAPRFVLTDLQPQIEQWSRIQRAFPERVTFVPDPVDATRIPTALGHRRARVIVNALHHFAPPLAGEILRRASEGSCGVFIAEGFERGPLGFAPFAFAGIPALYVNPALSPKLNVQKAALTWLTPAALAISVWDGLVSTMRVYTERELREMVAPLGPSYRWEYGTYPLVPFGRGYYFYGIPVPRTGARAA